MSIRGQGVANMDKLFLSVQDLAERYGVPVPTVYAWIHKGTGPRSLKIGKYRRFRVEDVERWEAGRADGPRLAG